MIHVGIRLCEKVRVNEYLFLHCPTYALTLSLFFRVQQHMFQEAKDAITPPSVFTGRARFGGAAGAQRTAGRWNQRRQGRVRERRGCK